MEVKDLNPEIQGTVTTGSEPEVKEEKDAKPSESSTDEKKGAKEGESPDAEKDMPWHKDPRFQKDLSLLKVAKALMEANGVEDVEELADMVEKGRKVKGKSVDLEKLDDIVAKAARLDQYEDYWEKQKQAKLRDEDPDNYTKVLENKIKELEGRDKAKAEQEQAAKNAQNAVKFYERTVNEMLDDLEDFPKEQRGFISLVMGVQNPSNDIDITDRKAIKKTYTDILKSVKSFAEAMKQQGAEEYRKGKLEIPKVATTTPATTQTEKKIYLKDARKALMDKMMGAMGG